MLQRIAEALRASCRETDLGVPLRRRRVRAAAAGNEPVGARVVAEKIQEAAVRQDSDDRQRRADLLGRHRRLSPRTARRDEHHPRRRPSVLRRQARRAGARIATAAEGSRWQASSSRPSRLPLEPPQPVHRARLSGRSLGLTPRSRPARGGLSLDRDHGRPSSRPSASPRRPGSGRCTAPVRVLVKQVFADARPRRRSAPSVISVPRRCGEPRC